MCGRYTLTAPAEVLTEIFELEDSYEFQPRYNIAPTQEVPIVGLDHEGKRRLGPMRWGLIPSWAKDPSIGNRLINARSETVAEKPAFRSSFAKRRCLVPADGFYEWKKLEGGRKQPTHIRLQDHRPFAIAGLWSRWRREDEDPILSFTLLTTTPNELTAEVHDRMPVILPPDAYEAWLAPETPREVLQGLLGPFPAAAMEAYAVSPLVNNPRNDLAQCLDPV